MTYHGSILPFRLEILNSIPETTPPHKYQDILPELDPGFQNSRLLIKVAKIETYNNLDQMEVLWEETNWREIPDWVESLDILQKLGLKEECDISDIKQARLGLLEKMQKQMSQSSKDFFSETDTNDSSFAEHISHSIPPTQKRPHYDSLALNHRQKNAPKLPLPDYPKLETEIKEWYLTRSKQMEEYAGQIENANALLVIGSQKVKFFAGVMSHGVVLFLDYFALLRKTYLVWMK